MKTIKILCLSLSLVLALAGLAMSFYSLGLAHGAAPVAAVDTSCEGESCKPPCGGPCPRKCRKIVCDELVIRSKDGKHSVVISATQGGVGVWISGPKGRCVSLVSRDGYTGPWIGIHKDGESACSWGVQLDKDGNPFVQSIVDGKVKHTPVGK